MWLTRFLLFTLLCEAIISVSGLEIYNPKTFQLLTPDIVHRELKNSFDNNHDTNTMFHSSTDKTIEIMMAYDGSLLIESVAIVADLPDQVVQQIHVGSSELVDNKTSTIAFQCETSDRDTICKLPCNTTESRSGIIGNTIYWSIKRKEVEGWTRIYDVIVKGHKVEENVVDGTIDVTMLKPYHEVNRPHSQPESCSLSLWRLTDASPWSLQSVPSVTTPEPTLVTFYLGGGYSIDRIDVAVGDQVSDDDQRTFKFASKSPREESINIRRDCSEGSVGGLFTCRIRDIQDIPVNGLTLDVTNLLKLHVYGRPFNYPKVAISTESLDSTQEHRLTCQIATCSNANSLSLDGVGGISSCSHLGRELACKSIQLTRLSPQESHEAKRLDLIEGNQIEARIGEVLPEMRIDEMTSNKLVVVMPQTYHYYAQYQCSCTTDDVYETKIESSKTAFTPVDFSSEIVFEQFIGTTDNASRAKHGFLETSTNELAYLTVTANGHTFFKNSKMNVSFVESGTETVYDGYGELSEVYPLGKTFDWSFPTYKHSQTEFYPDNVDGNVIAMDWDVEVKPSSGFQHITNLARIIRKGGPIRGWVWHHDAESVQFRVYSPFTNLTARQIYLERSGCSSGNGEGPQRLVGVRVSADQSCQLELSPDIKVECFTLDHGHSVVFTVPNPSLSDSYQVFETDSENGETPNAVVRLMATMDNLADDLKTAKLDLHIASIDSFQPGQPTGMQFNAHVLSKIIVDTAKCTEIKLQLMPKFATESSASQSIDRDVIPFTFTVPADQSQLEFDAEFKATSLPDDAVERVGVDGLVNPYAYKVELAPSVDQNAVTWTRPPVSLEPLIRSFKVVVESKLEACSQESVHEKIVKANEGIVDETGYRLLLSDVHESFSSDQSNHVVIYRVKVWPQFQLTSGPDARVDGHESQELVMRHGRVGKTRLNVDDKQSGSSKVIIQLLASQSVPDCPFTPSFDLQVTGDGADQNRYIEQVKYEPVEGMGEGQWFMVKDLVPGRSYSMKAKAVYATGLKDEMSEVLNFWTKEDVKIDRDVIYASVGDRVEVTCTASVGPADGQRKTVHWLREDGSQLPEGSQSFVSGQPDSPDWLMTASLVFDNLERGQSNRYACSVRPSVHDLTNGKAEDEFPVVEIVASDISIDIGEKAVAAGESIEVKCMLESGEMEWINPSGAVLSQEPNGAGAYVERIDKGLVLHIPSAKLTSTGAYHCNQVGTKIGGEFKLQLAESIEAVEPSMTNLVSGDQTTVVCRGVMATDKRHVNWFTQPTSGQLWLPIHPGNIDGQHSISLTDPDAGKFEATLLFINSPRWVGRVACVIDADEVDDKSGAVEKLPEQSAITELTIVPKIKMGQVGKNEAGEVIIECLGYPADADTHIGWFYVGDSSSRVNHSLIIPIPVKDDVVAPTLDEAETVIVDLVKQSLTVANHQPAIWPGGPSKPINGIQSQVDDSVLPERLHLTLKVERPVNSSERFAGQGQTSSVRCFYPTAKDGQQGDAVRLEDKNGEEEEKDQFIEQQVQSLIDFESGAAVDDSVLKPTHKGGNGARALAIISPCLMLLTTLLSIAMATHSIGCLA